MESVLRKAEVHRNGIIFQKGMQLLACYSFYSRPEDPLSNRCSGIAVIILRVENLNFEKIDFFLFKIMCKISRRTVALLRTFKK